MSKDINPTECAERMLSLLNEKDARIDELEAELGRLREAVAERDKTIIQFADTSNTLEKQRNNAIAKVETLRTRLRRRHQSTQGVHL